MKRSLISRSERTGYGSGRSELVHAAIALVAADGIAGLSHRAVADRAGVAHGLVRHYFGSINALIAEALDVVLNESQQDDPVHLIFEAPSFFNKAVLAWIEDQSEQQLFQYELILASRRQSELRPLVDKLYRRYADSARAGFASRGLVMPSDDEIELFVAAMDGIVLQAVTRSESEDGLRLSGAITSLRRLVGERIRTQASE